MCLRVNWPAPLLDNESNPLIPLILTFTYKCDLLINGACHYDPTADPEATKKEDAFRANMWSTITMLGGSQCSPTAEKQSWTAAWSSNCPASTCLTCLTGDSLRGNMTVHFYDDKACRNAVKQEHALLLDHFDMETSGPYRADMCRGAALLKHGGHYFDLDMKVRTDTTKLISHGTTFVSVVMRLDAQEERHLRLTDPDGSTDRLAAGQFFQAFIAVTPDNAIMRYYMEEMTRWYNTQGTSGKDERLLGPAAIHDAYLRAMQESTQQVQLWYEDKLQKVKDISVRASADVDNGENGRCGGASQFVVYDPLSDTVPFFSRTEATSQGIVCSS